jgi:ketosteroid isomerase-like protein
MATKKQKTNVNVIKKFFTCLKKIHAGDLKAVDAMLKLWDEDGTIELTGISPYTGKFTGLNAIAVLYKNVARSAGMPLKLEKDRKETALGPRKFNVESIRAVGENRVVANWTTVISTKDGRGFLVAGGDTFVLKGNKIYSDLFIQSPKAEIVRGFKMEGLTVNDIGRLALAAWPVV